jgi:hypothetical protein
LNQQHGCRHGDRPEKPHALPFMFLIVMIHVELQSAARQYAPNAVFWHCDDYTGWLLD